MNIDSSQFLKDGYLVIKNVVPPDQLAPLRHSCEILAERQRALSISDWESVPSPTVAINEVCDSETMNVVRFLLHDNTMGVSQQLLNSSQLALVLMQVMCNPIKDFGPGSWHRDIKPNYQAPLCGVQEDMMTNGPSFLQWNIALYDDNNFCLVPGTHQRPNTADENQRLVDNPQGALPEGVVADLKAGDGVVYLNWMLHRGARYSPKQRRTIHQVYRTFGDNNTPNYNGLFFYWDSDLVEKLPADCQPVFKRYLELGKQERALWASVLYSILQADPVGFKANLSTLHAAEKGQMVTVILLSKLAFRIRSLKNPSLVQPLPSERKVDFDVAQGTVRRSTTALPAPPKEPEVHWYQLEDIAKRFSVEDLDTLWDRFAVLDAKLKTNQEEFNPGFQFGPSPYRFNAMPEDFEVEDFIASWTR